MLSYLKIYLYKENSMLGMRHCGGSHAEGYWAVGRHRRGRFGRRGFGPGGEGGDDMLRAGRMLAQGDLRHIVLALIAEQPRHGYEIIKLIEEKTADWYSPSPGIVYPTLTYLEDVGYLTAQADGAKKLYTITDEGRAHLEQSRDLTDAILERLAAIGERAARWRGRERGERRDFPPLVAAALDNLRAAAAKRLADEGEEEAIAEVLTRAAAELRRK
jgi:DNA-binding PadR family transcriptional regulator